MKIKAIILGILVLIIGAMPADASNLPKNIKDFLQEQKKIPTIRFDGLIIYNENIMYIPIYPAYPQEVEKVSIVKTIPKNQNMDSLPDVVVFNNNYSLLKIVRVDENTMTVKNTEEMPEEVKTGLIPQDIVVPRGLVLPESLSGIIGDVHIPLVGSAKTKSFIIGKRRAPLPDGSRVADTKIQNVPAALKNKLFFVNNFQTEYLEVFSSTVSEPLFSLKTSGVMRDIKPIFGGKYILAATNKQKNIDVIDVTNEYVVKNITLTSNPAEIAVDEANKKAYVTSVDDDSLFVIDIESFKLKEKIRLIGSPRKIAVSKDGNKIVYTDIKTSNVYVLDLENNYRNKLVTKYPNITKLIFSDYGLYMIARTKPQLRIVGYDLLQDEKYTQTKKERKRAEEDKEAKELDVERSTTDIISAFENYTPDDSDEITGKEKVYATGIKDINVGQKPVDMFEKNGKIYVLCAGDNTVYTYNINTAEILATQLPVGGFSKTITPVENSNIAVITNMSDLKYVVYDIDKDKPLQTQPISEYINMILILEKNK